MRGSYNITDEDRRRFFHALLEFMRQKKGWYDLIGTNLCLSNCDDLVGELGYERETCETNGWEGELWWTFCHPKAPSIGFMASGYLGELNMYFPCYDDGKEPDVEALREVIKEHWGKYFEVV